MGGGRTKVRCEIDRIKTTKDHNYQQLERQDLLFLMSVTLDTTHLLMSALNKDAPQKAVWEEEKGKRKKEKDR